MPLPDDAAAHDLVQSIIQGNVRNMLDHVDFYGAKVEFVLVMFAEGRALTGVNLLADPDLSSQRIVEALEIAAQQAARLSDL